MDLKSGRVFYFRDKPLGIISIWALMNPWSQRDHPGAAYRVKREEDQEGHSEEILTFKRKTKEVKPSKSRRRHTKIFKNHHRLELRDRDSMRWKEAFLQAGWKKPPSWKHMLPFMQKGGELRARPKRPVGGARNHGDLFPGLGPNQSAGPEGSTCAQLDFRAVTDIRASCLLLSQ